MTPSQNQQAVLQASLHAVDAHDKLCVIAAVSGINENRIRAIMNGAEPSLHEFVTLDNLRTMS